jgi:Ca2+-binding EF-hand superfamily protein
MKGLSKIAIGGLLLCATPAMVAAQTISNKSLASNLMQRLDVNKDGVISLKEAVRHTALLRNFGLIDGNEDGKLTVSELATSQLTPGQRLSENTASNNKQT